MIPAALHPNDLPDQGAPVRDDAPATRPFVMPPTPDAVRRVVEAPSTDPYLATDEPTIAQAANLLQKILASGAVARLDVLHDALMIAHRRGRAAERAEVQRIAEEHAAAFAAAVVERADREFRDDSRAWCER